jgi:tetratricopeptide (TPR) repeat protein
MKRGYLVVCAALLGASAASSAAAQPRPQEAPQSPGLPKLQEALRALSEQGAAGAATAKSALEAAIAADPGLEEAHYNLFVLAVRANDLAGAAKVADAMMGALPNSPGALAARGYAHELAGEESQAKALYDRALAVDRTAALANNYLAGKAVRAGQWPDVIRYSRLALVSDPQSVNAYLNLATAYYETNQLELARLVLANALGIDSQSAPLHNMLGLVLLKMDNVRDALAEFNVAVQLDAGNLDARMNAGTLTLSYSDFDTALAHFDAVLAAKPDNRAAVLSRGVALRGLQRYEDAEAVYQGLVQANGRDFEARYNQCILHNEFTSNYKRALELCSALERDLPSDHPKRAELEARVKGIKTTIEALGGG